MAESLQRGVLGSEPGEMGQDTAPVEIEAGEAPQRAPRAKPAGFDPLATCPKEQRERWKRRAATAHAHPMKAIELKCLDCVAWYRPEARDCQITNCALWPLSRRIFRQ